MSYKALYREYRPQNLNDIVGQEHITTTLRNQLISNKIAHAYLFCGTRGTGKTSAAKVFAKALNCENNKDGEPCNECEICNNINRGIELDVVELDAASNNGVNNIREIAEQIKYPPRNCKYKVYIMDEVHMLSTGAVNAFLKTLEEPPNNVIFILATTDPQKLPMTILSRCQRFDFKRINKNDMNNRLKYIINDKQINCDDKSINLISKVSDGAMRDAISILDQAIARGNGEVNYNELIDMLGLINNEYIFTLTDKLIERNVENSLLIVNDIDLNGKDMYFFIKDLILHFRNLLMAKVTSNSEEVLKMSDDNIHLVKEQSKKINAEQIIRYIKIFQEAEVDAKLSNQPRIYIELAILKICNLNYDISNEAIIMRLSKLENDYKNINKITNTVTNKVTNIDTNTTTNEVINTATNITTDTTTNEVTNTTKENKKPIDLESIKKSWDSILNRFKEEKYFLMYASLVTGEVMSYENNVLTIYYPENYKFNAIKLSREVNNKIISRIVSEYFKIKIIVKFV